MDFLFRYGLFLAEALTIVIAIVAVVGGILALLAKARLGGRERLEVKRLNDKYRAMARIIRGGILSKREFKKALKREKKTARVTVPRRRIFVLNFEGDIRASNLASLREEITSLLTVADRGDEVFLRLHSGGGLVHSYGLAASQLGRIKDRNIPLTISVDNIAASGGYMMACVADRIIAAPFAIIGSIGVIAQVPNFHRWLKKNDIDYEQFTAGEFKRTVTMFGENTDKARAKFREEIEDTHVLFKEFIVENRPNLDIARVSTGEYWPGKRALELGLVDELLTSDDYLLAHSEEADLYELHYVRRRPVGVKMPWFVKDPAPWQTPEGPGSL